MNLTEGETRALLGSCLLVLLATVGRLALQPRPAALETEGLRRAGRVDSALAVAESIHARVQRRREPLGPGERIDPNTASEVELDRLPGVGEALARAIVSSRVREGPFRSLADLERVRGLGSSSVERLAPYVTLPRVRGSEPRTRETLGTEGLTNPSVARRLNLNRASLAELEALPGIGPARAGAIIRWREGHGPFKVVEELLEVPGIGPATLERLRPWVTVGS